MSRRITLASTTLLATLAVLIAIVAAGHLDRQPAAQAAQFAPAAPAAPAAQATQAAPAAPVDAAGGTVVPAVGPPGPLRFSNFTCSSQSDDQPPGQGMLICGAVWFGGADPADAFWKTDPLLTGREVTVEPTLGQTTLKVPCFESRTFRVTVTIVDADRTEIEDSTVAACNPRPKPPRISSLGCGAFPSLDWWRFKCTVFWTGGTAPVVLTWRSYYHVTPDYTGVGRAEATGVCPRGISTSASVTIRDADGQEDTRTASGFCP